jgi:hypothetical protein
MEDFRGIVLRVEGDNILASGGVSVLTDSVRSTGESIALTTVLLFGLPTVCYRCASCNAPCARDQSVKLKQPALCLRCCRWKNRWPKEKPVNVARSQLDAKG